MSLLVLFARKMSLKSQINDYNFKLMQKKQELMDLQKYTASIADGEVSLNDLSTAPSSVFGRMSQYMVASHNYSAGAAQQNMAYLQGSGQMQPVSPDGAAQMQYQQLVFQNLYNQQRDQFRKAEEARLNVKNKALDNECLSIEQQLKQLETEYEKLGSVVDKYAQQSAPQYA